MTQQAHNQYCRFCGKHLNEHITGMRLGVPMMGVPDPHGGTFWCTEWNADNHYSEGAIQALDHITRSLKHRISRLHGKTWGREELLRFMKKWEREGNQRRTSLRRIGVELRAHFKGPQ